MFAIFFTILFIFLSFFFVDNRISQWKRYIKIFEDIKIFIANVFFLIRIARTF